MISERTHRWLGWGAVIVFPALALAVGRGILQTPDGLSYLCDVRDGVGMFHPHHVLYGPLLAFFAAMVRPWGGDLLWAGQLLGAVSFAVLLAAGRSWLRSQGTAPVRALLLLVFLASLRGFPLYTVRVEVYLPFVATAAWLFVVTAGRDDLGLAPSSGRLIVATLLLALAALLHQLGALLAVPMLLTPWASFRDRLGVVIGGGVMAFAGSWLGHRWGGEGEFLSWLVTYAAADVSEWGSFAHWTPTGCRDLAASLATMVAPVPSAFAAIGAVVVAVVLLWLATRVFGGRRDQRSRMTTRFAMTALVTQSVFVLWWLPSDTDFALPSLWMIWVLIVVGWPRRFERQTLAVAALVLSMVSYGVALPRLARIGTETRAIIEDPGSVNMDQDDYEKRQLRRWLTGNVQESPKN